MLTYWLCNLSQYYDNMDQVVNDFILQGIVFDIIGEK